LPYSVPRANNKQVGRHSISLLEARHGTRHAILQI